MFVLSHIQRHSSRLPEGGFESESLFRAIRLASSSLAAAVLIIAAGPAATVTAQGKIKPVATNWTVSENFKKNAADEDLDKQARTNLSGAACTSKKPPFATCLIVNDEKKYAQFFAIDQTVLKPGAVIRLVDKEPKGDPDSEGAAYDRGYFYVVGSHGRSRHHPEKNSTPSYTVFRFPVDPATGKTAFPISNDDVVGVQSSSRLREAIQAGKTISDFYDKKLDENGVNIEGIAVTDGRMYLGLRGPSLENHGFIVSVDAEAPFSNNANLNASVDRLRLGPSTGIRDLAAVQNGLLVLAGPVNEQAVPPAVYFWDKTSEIPKKLGELAIPDKFAGQAKAEILLVLDDTEGKPWRILVMFDGQENGAPTEYLIPR